jgi:hypothetical protein
MTNGRARARARRAQGVSRHGIAEPRGQKLPADADKPRNLFQRLLHSDEPAVGRFGRMLDFRGDPVSDGAIEELVGLMKQRGADERSSNIRIPAGFTYLAQFIDHDITFDPMSIFARRVDEHAIKNFRTPRLDLDSVYGSGPRVHPFLYDWDADPPGTKLLVGRNAIGRALASEDLPRNQQGRALIGDARNDEHVIITQLHLLFVRLHNAVVDHLAAKDPPRTQDQRTALRLNAQETVRWHYQWTVVHEFLCRVVGDDMGKQVLHRVATDQPPTRNDKCFKWRGGPFIPVEFSGAAYRFGHSMVRAIYRVKPSDAGAPLSIFPDLTGFRWLPESLVVDWDLFFERAGDQNGGYQLPTENLELQFSSPIDTAIAGPLFDLPEAGGALPRRNLQTGSKLAVPSGQAVARAMNEKVLDEDELRLGDCGQGVRGELARSTPLWYYVLCEAALEPCLGAHLGRVGGRIVAEVLVHLLKWDEKSYLNANPAWKPTLGATDGHFTMADLIRIAQNGVDG